MIFTCTMIDNLRETLESHGEVIIILDSGSEYELHLGNTEFDGDRIVVDTITEQHVLDATKVESYYVHYDV